MTNIIAFPEKESKFAIGDVVTLNSGGPSCIVTNVEDDFVTHSCFLEDGSVSSYAIPEACLQLLYKAPTCDEDGFWSNCI